MVQSALFPRVAAGYNPQWMRSLFRLALAVVTLPVQASVVDVSASETVFVRSGDTLTFELLTGSYPLHAQALGLPLYPESLQFAVVTAPRGAAGEFAASLASADASNGIAFAAPLGFTSGYVASAGYQGTVDTLLGQVQLASGLSQDLFVGGTVQLRLLNLGGDITLGLPSLLLGQDLFSSLSGGPLSVGARVGAVTLEGADSPLRRGFGASGVTADVVVPEPDTGWLLLAGVLLGAFCFRPARLSSTRR